ncbi:hypothetical protein CUMW_286890, partial [Citrus unshiu]
MRDTQADVPSARNAFRPQLAASKTPRRMVHGRFCSHLATQLIAGSRLRSFIDPRARRVSPLPRVVLDTCERRRCTPRRTVSGAPGACSLVDPGAAARVRVCSGTTSPVSPRPCGAKESA